MQEEVTLKVPSKFDHEYDNKNNSSLNPKNIDEEKFGTTSPG